MQYPKLHHLAALAASVVLALTAIPAVAQEGEEESRARTQLEERARSVLCRNQRQHRHLELRPRLQGQPQADALGPGSPRLVHPRRRRRRRHRRAVLRRCSWAAAAQRPLVDLRGPQLGARPVQRIRQLGTWPRPAPSFIAVKSDHHTLSFDAGLTWTSEDQITLRRCRRWTRVHRHGGLARRGCGSEVGLGLQQVRVADASGCSTTPTSTTPPTGGSVRTPR